MNSIFYPCFYLRSFKAGRMNTVLILGKRAGGAASCSGTFYRSSSSWLLHGHFSPHQRQWRWWQQRWSINTHHLDTPPCVGEKGEAMVLTGAMERRMLLNYPCVVSYRNAVSSFLKRFLCFLVILSWINRLTCIVFVVLKTVATIIVA